MPQLEQAKDQQPYGMAPNDNTKLFVDRLIERFSPTEFVTVQNVDDEAFMWQYLPESAERHEMRDGIHRDVYRADPEMWVIEPGQTEVIVGASAYQMIHSLYKKLVAKKRYAREGIDDPTMQHTAINFSFADGEQQEYWINRIYLGKATPTFTTASNPVEDLGITDAAPVTSAKDILAASAAKK